MYLASELIKPRLGSLIYQLTDTFDHSIFNTTKCRHPEDLADLNPTDHRQKDLRVSAMPNARVAAIKKKLNATKRQQTAAYSVGGRFTPIILRN